MEKPQSEKAKEEELKNLKVELQNLKDYYGSYQSKKKKLLGRLAEISTDKSIVEKIEASLGGTEGGGKQSGIKKVAQPIAKKGPVKATPKNAPGARKPLPSQEMYENLMRKVKSSTGGTAGGSAGPSSSSPPRQAARDVTNHSFSSGGDSTDKQSEDVIASLLEDARTRLEQEREERIKVVEENKVLYEELDVLRERLSLKVVSEHQYKSMLKFFGSWKQTMEKAPKSYYGDTREVPEEVYLKLKDEYTDLKERFRNLEMARKHFAKGKGSDVAASSLELKAENAEMRSEVDRLTRKVRTLEHVREEKISDIKQLEGELEEIKENSERLTVQCRKLESQLSTESTARRKADLDLVQSQVQTGRLEKKLGRLEELYKKDCSEADQRVREFESFKGALGERHDLLNRKFRSTFFKTVVAVTGETLHQQQLRAVQHWRYFTYEANLFALEDKVQATKMRSRSKAKNIETEAHADISQLEKQIADLQSEREATDEAHQREKAALEDRITELNDLIARQNENSQNQMLRVIEDQEITVVQMQTEKEKVIQQYEELQEKLESEQNHTKKVEDRVRQVRSFQKSLQRHYHYKCVQLSLRRLMSRVLHGWRCFISRDMIDRLELQIGEEVAEKEELLHINEADKEDFSKTFSQVKKDLTLMKSHLDESRTSEEQLQWKLVQAANKEKDLVEKMALMQAKVDELTPTIEQFQASEVLLNKQVKGLTSQQEQAMKVIDEKDEKINEIIKDKQQEIAAMVEAQEEMKKEMEAEVKKKKAAADEELQLGMKLFYAKESNRKVALKALNAWWRGTVNTRRAHLKEQLIRAIDDRERLNIDMREMEDRMREQVQMVKQQLDKEMQERVIAAHKLDEVDVHRQQLQDQLPLIARDYFGRLIRVRALQSWSRWAKENKRRKLEAQLDSATQSMNASDNDVSEGDRALREDLEMTIQSNQQLKTTIQDLEDEMGRLERENSNLRQSLSEYNHRVDDRTHDVHDLQRQLSESLANQESLSRDVKDQLAKARLDNMKTIEQSELEKMKMSNQLSRVQAEKEVLEKELNVIRSERAVSIKQREWTDDSSHRHLAMERQFHSPIDMSKRPTLPTESPHHETMSFAPKSTTAVKPDFASPHSGEGDYSGLSPFNLQSSPSTIHGTASSMHRTGTPASATSSTHSHTGRKNLADKLYRALADRDNITKELVDLKYEAAQARTEKEAAMSRLRYNRRNFEEENFRR